MLLSGRQRPTCRGAGCRLPAALRTADRVRDASRGGQLRSSAGTGHSSLPGQIPPAAFMKQACSEHAATATSLQLADAALEKRDCLQPPQAPDAVCQSSAAPVPGPAVRLCKSAAEGARLAAAFRSFSSVPGSTWKLLETNSHAGSLARLHARCSEPGRAAEHQAGWHSPRARRMCTLHEGRKRRRPAGFTSRSSWITGPDRRPHCPRPAQGE